MTRPAFDATVYETPELAEINRPLHDLAWDHIEAQRAYRALTARSPRMIEAHNTMMVARAAYDVANAIARDLEEAYLDRRANEAPVEDMGDAADQIGFAL